MFGSVEKLDQNASEGSNDTMGALDIAGLHDKRDPPQLTPMGSRR